MCAQAAEPELRRQRVAEPEKADAEKAAEVILLRKALEAADRRATPKEEEAAAEREAKRMAEAKVRRPWRTPWCSSAELRSCRPTSRGALWRSTSIRSI
ncbi:hypothetical protein ACSQ67_006587 [Phaseolus vulgaris]